MVLFDYQQLLPVYLIGYDIGSSSIKAALVNAETKETVKTTQFPNQEMAIDAPEPDWAEQDPKSWWDNLCIATKLLLKATQVDPNEIKAVGIAYQMHGLVLVDEQLEVVRPSIIWCDSRAVTIGDQAFEELGAQQCLTNYLNSPGNFTASKLKWVLENEPEVYAKTKYMMLPGDYIGMKLTGQVVTTVSGLSEGILWDFQKKDIAKELLSHYGIEAALIPKIVPTFSNQGLITQEASAATGLPAGIPIGYRAGDQPNNALALNVTEPGEVAATGGTSGVVYGVVDQAVYDQGSRVNGFAHVNYTHDDPRIGILLCINGAGIMYSWAKQYIGQNKYDYPEMEVLASEVPLGSDGLIMLPFGNGAERMLLNKQLGAQMINLQLNRHKTAHLFRAALEGIAFSFVYGMEILLDIGLDLKALKVGNDNLFQSEIFSKTIATVMNCSIEVVETTGAVGAAKGAGYGVGLFPNLKSALSGNKVLFAYKPDVNRDAYHQAYQNWKNAVLAKM